MDLSAHLDPLVIWRQINAVLSLVGMVLLVRRLRRYNPHWTFQERSFLWAGFVFTLTGLVASIENLLMEAPFGYRLPLSSLAMLLLIHSMLGESVRHGGVGK